MRKASKAATPKMPMKPMMPKSAMKPMMSGKSSMMGNRKK